MKKITPLLIIIFLLVFVSCSIIPIKNREETRSKSIDEIGYGNKFEKDKNYSRAIDKYLDSVETSPSPAGYYHAAKCYSEIGELDKAIIYYEKAIALSPQFKNAITELENVKARKRTGQIFFSEKIEHKDILQELNSTQSEFIKQEKETPLTAEISSDKKRELPKKEDIDKILFPSIYSSKKEDKEKKPIAHKEVDLTSYDYHKGKAEFYKSNGHYNAAIGEYLDALKYNPDDLYSKIEIATLYGKIGRNKKGEESFDELIKNNPYEPLVFFKAGNFYQQSGNIEKAKQLQNAALKLDPNYIPSLNNLGVILMNEKKYDDSLNYFTKIIQLDEKYANAYLNLGIIYEEHFKNFPKSKEFYEKYLSLGGVRKDEVKKWIENLDKY